MDTEHSPNPIDQILALKLELEELKLYASTVTIERNTLMEVIKQLFTGDDSHGDPEKRP